MLTIWLYIFAYLSSHFLIPSSVKWSWWIKGFVFSSGIWYVSGIWYRHLNSVFSLFVGYREWLFCTFLVILSTIIFQMFTNMMDKKTISSFVTCLFIFFTHFSIRLFTFFLLTWMSSLYVKKYQSFIRLNFDIQKFLIFMWLNFFFHVFWVLYFV